MDRSFLLVLCLVTLSNVQLGQSQCDGKGIDNAWHHNLALHDVFAAVVRIAAAVHEVVGPGFETMQKDLKNMKSDMASLSQKVEKLDTRLSFLNESMRDDFSGVERGLTGLNSTANMI